MFVVTNTHLMEYKIDNNVISVTLTDKSHRKFQIEFPNLNLIDCYSAKLLSGEYSFNVTNKHLEITFKYDNIKQPTYTIYLEEVFDTIYLNLINFKMKTIVMSFLNQINYLKLTKNNYKLFFLSLGVMFLLKHTTKLLHYKCNFYNCP